MRGCFLQPVRSNGRKHDSSICVSCITQHVSRFARKGGVAMTDMMRVAIGQFSELSHERLTFARQLGASGVLLNTPVLPGTERWEVADLLWLRKRCEDHGLRLEAIENTPVSFYDKAMLGLPGRIGRASCRETV